MRIHILGIGGTFMTGVALLARALGHEVEGSDGVLYPPMSEVLAQAGIAVSSGYDARYLRPAPDLVVIGNALSRGNPAVEYVLDRGLRYTSGPAFVADQVLAGRNVVAVAGTHGKTTTTSLLAWLLESAGHAPGFLIGGLPENFPLPARLGSGRTFVIEADEYDSAFFDKRAKFIHYHPQALALLNLEFDHADIFPDLASIERQFHYLVRTVPASGRIVANGGDAVLARVLVMGCWTPVEQFGRGPAASLSAQMIAPERFELWVDGAPYATLTWELRGGHNVENALAALATARFVGVPLDTALGALASFRGVRRRLTLLLEAENIRLYDDFAHHPTAIERTLAALATEGRRQLVVFEPRSRSMREGAYSERLTAAFRQADRLFLLERADLAWNPRLQLKALGPRVVVEREVAALAERVCAEVQPGDDVIIMSNGGFGGMPDRLKAMLAARVKE